MQQLLVMVRRDLGVACIANFLFLIDYAARMLRPVSVVAKVGDEGMSMIKAVYPDPASAVPLEETALHTMPERPSREVGHHSASEIVLAVDLRDGL